MKYAIISIMLLLCAFNVNAQDVKAYPNANYYVDSLSSTHDTVDVSFRSDLDFEYYQVSAYSTAADTLIVSVETDNGSRFVQHGVVNLASAAKAASMITGTTAIDFIVIGGKELRRLRFTSAALPNAIYFIVSGKHGDPVY